MISHVLEDLTAALAALPSLSISLSLSLCTYIYIYIHMYINGFLLEKPMFEAEGPKTCCLQGARTNQHQIRKGDRGPPPTLEDPTSC